MNKDDFPIFQNHPELVYLDSAASAHKPQSVIDAMVHFYTEHNSNVHRGLYGLSEEATELYEEARKTIAKFINAEPEEIIFTSGTTDSLNAVADMLVRSKLINEKPRILLSSLEHHSNILPWQRIPGAQMNWLPVPNRPVKISENGVERDGTSFMYTTDLAEHHFYIDGPFDVISLSLTSNVTGANFNQADLIELLEKHGKETFKVIDAAQSVAHEKIDVKEMGVDFLAFSGHKMYGPTGIGVLYIKKELHDKLEPYRVGGGMIETVRKNEVTWAAAPAKFEAGTPPIAQAIGLAAAVKYIESIGWGKIQEHEKELNRYSYTKLKEVENLKLFHPENVDEHGGVFSFVLNGAHAHDVSQILAEQNICVRAGHHCTQILHREVFDVPATVRASIGIYNTKEDIDKLVSALAGVLKMLS